MKIDIKQYLLNYIGDMGWDGETRHDDQSSINMDKADEVLSFLKDISTDIFDELFNHRKYRKGNASAEHLHKKAKEIFEMHKDDFIGIKSIIEYWDD